MKRIWVVLGALMVTGCATPKLVSNEHLTVTSADSLPPPTRPDLSGDERAYLLGPADKIDVAVFGFAELSKEVQIGADGEVALPLIGQVKAGGRTTAELAKDVRTRLMGAYVRDPQVSINIKEATSQVITVDGEVREPGLYPVVGRMTLTRAIVVAKGATEFARLNDVVVLRTVNGRRMAALYRLGDIRLGRYTDPEVYANDTVVVGNSEARRLFRDIIQASPLITTPIIAIASF